MSVERTKIDVDENDHRQVLCHRSKILWDVGEELPDVDVEEQAREVCRRWAENELTGREFKSEDEQNRRLG